MRLIPVMPVKVEYGLTQKGLSIMPLLTSLKNWGQEWTGKADKAKK